MALVAMPGRQNSVRNIHSRKGNETMMDDRQLQLLLTGWFESPNPAQQIAAEVAVMVRSGEIPAFDRLPSNEELGRKFETKETTVMVAKKVLFDAMTGLIRQDLSWYRAAVYVSGEERPDPERVAAWAKSLDVVSRIMADIAEGISEGRIAGREALPSEETVAEVWSCHPRTAYTAMRLLCQYAALVAKKGDVFYAVSEAA
jgi:DNA-binding transcriptional regulator YhcF (GntR family)